MKKERQLKNRKRLRLIPLILGGYGAFLGFGLAAIGFTEMKEGIGIVRLLIGFGMAGFGMLGIWDGVRDWVIPDKNPGKVQASQFILTDTSGNRSSLVTPELLREQMDILVKNEDYRSFNLQILPPFSAGEQGGMLTQIACIYHYHMILVAFFEMPEEGYRIYQKSAEPDMAVEWLKQLLTGSPDFSGWESIETNAGQDEVGDSQKEEEFQWGGEDACPDETDSCLRGTDVCPGEADTCLDEADTLQEDVESFWHHLLDGQNGRMTYWRQLLVIFGESWHDEHRFFSARDVELAVEGVHEEKYRKVVLEWGIQAFDLFPGVQNEIMVIWCSNNTGKGDFRFLAKEGTVTQVKFWLVNFLNHGFFEEMVGWVDITAQIEKEKRKDEKRREIMGRHRNR